MVVIKKYISVFLIGMIFILSCSDDNEVGDKPKDILELEASYKIDVLDPSGLAVSSSGEVLYTVSDNTAEVYKLSKTGDIVQTYDVESIAQKL